MQAHVWRREHEAVTDEKELFYYDNVRGRWGQGLWQPCCWRCNWLLQPHCPPPSKAPPDTERTGRPLLKERCCAQAVMVCIVEHSPTHPHLARPLPLLSMPPQVHPQDVVTGTGHRIVAEMLISFVQATARDLLLRPLGLEDEQIVQVWWVGCLGGAMACGWVHVCGCVMEGCWLHAFTTI